MKLLLAKEWLNSFQSKSISLFSSFIEFMFSITKESIVDISGTISKASVISCSQHGIELIAESCFVVSAAPERLPFPIGDAKVDSAVEDGNNSNKESSEADLAKVNLDTRLNYRYFELRVCISKRKSMILIITIDHSQSGNLWIAIRDLHAIS